MYFKTLLQRRSFNKLTRSQFQYTSKSLKELKKPLLEYSNYDSLKIWFESLTNYDQGDQDSQDDLLTYYLPYYNKEPLVELPKDKIVAYNVKTQVKNNDSDYFISEIRVDRFPLKEKIKPAKKNHLVILHGYGASSGWFYKNFDGLVKGADFVDECNESFHIHAIDMLGFGLSGRPIIRFKHDSDTKPALDIECDCIFKNDKHLVCGECGGHLDGKENKDWCVCESDNDLSNPKLKKAHVWIKSDDAIEYIKNQRKLINEVEEVYVESLENWRIKNKIQKFDLVAHSFGGYMSVAYAIKYPERVNRLVLASPGGVERSPFSVTNPKYQELSILKDEGVKIPSKIGMVVSNNVLNYGFLGRYGTIKEWFRNIWRMRLSVFTFLRWLGPIGPKIVCDRNVDKLTRSGSINNKQEIDLFIKYVYNNCLRSSFSDTTITRIFDSSIVAKYPILDKLKDLKVKDTLWIYGEHDFMYKEAGRAATKILNLRQGYNAKFDTVSNAGHNLYLDNYKEFDKKVVEFLKIK